MLRRTLYKGLFAVGAAAVMATPALVYAAGGRRAGDYADAVYLAPVFFAAGALAFWKRPDHRCARWLLATGSLIPLSHAMALVPAAVGSGEEPLWIPNLLSRVSFAVAFAVWGAVYAVFPDGRYVRTYERVFVRLVVGAAVLLPLAGFFSRSRSELIYTVSTPATRVPWSAAFLPPAGVWSAFAVAPVAGVVLLVLRYRRAESAQRAQMRWPVAAAALVAFALASTPLMRSVFGVVPQAVFFMLAATTLPLSLVIGMLRHRLLDIDLVIRRSLVYGVLWLSIAALYGAVAGVLGLVAGARFSVGAAVAVAIVSAMLFQPARAHLEWLADRVVYGERLSRYELMRSLGSTLGGALNIEEVAPTLAATVRQGLDAAWTRVSLSAAEPARSVASDGIALDEQADAVLVSPLVHAGETVGSVECGPKRDGAYSDADRDLLTTLARQAALALRNARLASDLAERVAELAASRERIVEAAEVERRRIERDLHDGVQQQLIALAAKVELTRMHLAGGDMGSVDRMLREVAEAVRQAHAELRDLARGIHPAVLSDRGLVEAVEARTSLLPLPVAVEADVTLREARFPQALEGAAYFVVTEALTNVMKHAVASTATVRVSAAAGELLVEVEDDGIGFQPDGVTLYGLRGLRDRVEALGGTLTITGLPRATIVARLPTNERQLV